MFVDRHIVELLTNTIFFSIIILHPSSFIMVLILALHAIPENEPYEDVELSVHY